MDMEKSNQDEILTGADGRAGEEGRGQLGFGFRRSMERANEIFAGVVGAVRGNSGAALASADIHVGGEMASDEGNEGEERWRGWDKTRQRRRKERRG